MQKIQTIIVGVMTMLSLVLAPAIAGVGAVGAITPKESICNGSGGTLSGSTCTYPADAGTTDIKKLLKQIVDILLFVIGSIAVIMIVIGGIKYTTSNGDQSQVKGAKDTILYAVIGIVVAFMAYALVNFVIAQF